MNVALPSWAARALAALLCTAVSYAAPRPLLVATARPVAATLTSPPVTFGATLAAALDSVAASKISSDLYFIASDELGGRDTPSEGQRVAARFIRARLQRLGWLPGASDGYFYTYKLASQQIDERGTWAACARDGQRVELKFGSDYFFHYSAVSTAEYSGGVIFCENGEPAQLEGLDLTGKWALCYDSGTSYKTRQAAAKKAGALGVIVTPGPGYKEQDYEVRYADWPALANKASVRWPAKEGADPVFPYVYLTAKAGKRLLELARGTAADFQPTRGQDLQVAFTEQRRTVGQGGMIEVENVCGFWPGSDPTLSKDVMIVSAHYDHIGITNGKVNNGADDNGSGTCGLMALAEALSVRGPLKRSVLLIWVSGEEKGLWGSRAWAEHPWLPEGCKPVSDINIDMIGRNAPDKLLITPTKARKDFYNGLVRTAEELSPLEGFPTLGSCDEYWTRSDHKNFADFLKIPVTFLFSDIHEDYHKPTDDPDKIDYDKIRRVIRLVLRMLDAMQDADFDFSAK